MKTTTEKISFVAGILAGAFLIFLLVSLVVWALWNWLMPVIFNAPEITYIQTLGLVILIKLLFSTNSFMNKEKD